MKRQPPPAFKATIRTQSLVSNIVCGSIPEGVLWSFYSVPLEKQPALIAELKAVHQKMKTNHEQQNLG